ncbi:MAG: hypothetical protein ACKOTH_05110, partial [Solirubrobacterales bacterium]
ENATWRNAYLSGAMELRDGIPERGLRAQAPDIVRALDTGQALRPAPLPGLRARCRQGNCRPWEGTEHLTAKTGE